MNTKLLHFLRVAVCWHIFWLGSSSANAAVFSFQGTIEQVPGVPGFPDHTLDYFELRVNSPSLVTLTGGWVSGFGGSFYGVDLGFYAATEAALIPGGIPNSSVVIGPDRRTDISVNLLGVGRYYIVSRWSQTEWDSFEGMQPVFVSEAFGTGTYRIELEGDITMQRILEGQGDGTFRVTNLIPEPGALVLGLAGAAVFLSRRRRPR